MKIQQQGVEKTLSRHQEKGLTDYGYEFGSGSSGTGTTHRGITSVKQVEGAREDQSVVAMHYGVCLGGVRLWKS